MAEVDSAAPAPAPSSARCVGEDVGVRPVGDAYATGAPAFTGCARAGRPRRLFSRWERKPGDFLLLLSRRRLTGGSSDRDARSRPGRPALPVRPVRVRVAARSRWLVPLGVRSSAMPRPRPTPHGTGRPSCGRDIALWLQYHGSLVRR